jgi:hypothetical protein
VICLSAAGAVIKSRQRKGNAMSDDDTKAELERLRSENAALKKGASEGTRMKVSEKGAVSVYGMGRFPVTLYKEQWLKLLNMSDEIRAFIAENEARLKAKDWWLPSEYRFSARASRYAAPARSSLRRIRATAHKSPSQHGVVGFLHKLAPIGPLSDLILRRNNRGTKMIKANERYFAELSDSENGEPVYFDNEVIEASNDQEAIGKASKWASSHRLGVVAMLIVKQGFRGVHSRKIYLAA